MSDLRLAFRMLVRDRAFTVVSSLVLALGIGATTAVFTLIHSLLLSPLPYPDSGRLVWINGTPPQMAPGSSTIMGGDFLEIRDRNHSFQRVAGLIGGAWIVTSNGDPETIQGGRVSPGFFETLGIYPVLGRVFMPDEHRLGREMEVIYSHRYWQRRFGGDPGVVGRRIVMDGIPYEVVGILPAGFPMESEYDMFAPLQMDSSYILGRRARLIRALGRLKPGISVEKAQGEMNQFAAEFDQRFPADKGFTIHVSTFLEREVGRMRTSLWIFAAAVGCVLLIACSNAASLLLARGAARSREMALRTAIGASRALLIRQMLIESGIIALLGGALGLPLAAFGVKMLIRYDPRALPRSSDVHIDLVVFTFAIAASVITGFIFGIAPALRASRVGLSEALKDGGYNASGNRRGTRFRAALVVVEVALGVVLTAAAGLLARSLNALNSIDPGYRVDSVLTLQLATMGTKYRDPEESRRFYQKLVSTVQQMPGVQSAGSTNWLPLTPSRNWAGIWVDTQPVHTQENKTMLDNRVIEPGYLRAMGAPILAGRDFEWTDRPETPHVMIVNEAFARHFYPNQSAIGHRVTIDLGGTPYVAEIVGVAGNFRELSLSEPPRIGLFTPFAQTTIAGQTLVVRTVDDPATHVAAIRAAAAAIDPNVPIYHAATMRDQVDQSLAPQRLRGILLSMFSLVAMLLSSIGLYGLIACSVAERTQEIGIRMALGAQQNQVRRIVVGQGLLLTAIGLILGFAGAFPATRLLEGSLFGVKRTDPITFAATAAIFLSVTLIATYIPARRATAIDPSIVLRQ
jgi:putative ABC transport system permease protein